MITATKQTAVTAPGTLVLGYARVVEVGPPRPAASIEAIAAVARKHKPMLVTVFTDRMLAGECLVFRARVDLVHYVPPSGLVVPTGRHLSQWEHELRGLLQLIASLHYRVFSARALRRQSTERVGQHESSWR